MKDFIHRKCGTVVEWTLRAVGGAHGQASGTTWYCPHCKRVAQSHELEEKPND